MITTMCFFFQIYGISTAQKSSQLTYRCVFVWVCVCVCVCGKAPPEREICHLGLWKGLKGLTEKFYGFIKSRKRSIFVIDSYLNDSAFTAVKRDAKF